MLQDIVERAMARMAKLNWLPPTLEMSDLRQEAWVAVLAAMEEEGITDSEELQRLAELQMKKMIRAEVRQHAVPVSWTDDIED